MKEKLRDLFNKKIKSLSELYGIKNNYDFNITLESLEIMSPLTGTKRPSYDYKTATFVMPEAEWLLEENSKSQLTLMRDHEITHHLLYQNNIWFEDWKKNYYFLLYDEIMNEGLANIGALKLNGYGESKLKLFKDIIESLKPRNLESKITIEHIRIEEDWIKNEDGKKLTENIQNILDITFKGNDYKRLTKVSHNLALRWASIFCLKNLDQKDLIKYILELKNDKQHYDSYKTYFSILNKFRLK